MKKGLIIAVAAVAIIGVGGTYGYKIYHQKQEAKAYETKISKTIASLPPITVYEQEDLPTIEEEFTGTENIIDIDSIEPDISNVYTTEPGTYEVNYTFKDSKGTTRTATVPCTVKPNLINHVTGMKNIEIDQGEEIPEVETTFDEYVDSVTLNTDAVDNQEVGTYAISYSILGTDGDMVTADDYTCTVNEIPDLTQYVTGMKNIEIVQGEEIPTTVDVTFNSHIKSVTLNTENVDNKTPGEYPISYSIFGADGNMQSVDGYTCTVKEAEKTEEAQEDKTDAIKADNTDEDNDTVGNVEVQETVVETGDNTNFVAIIAALGVCAAAVGGAIIYRKKKKG